MWNKHSYTTFISTYEGKYLKKIFFNKSPWRDSHTERFSNLARFGYPFCDTFVFIFRKYEQANEKLRNASFVWWPMKIMKKTFRFEIKSKLRYLYKFYKMTNVISAYLNILLPFNIPWSLKGSGGIHAQLSRNRLWSFLVTSKIGWNISVQI